MLRSGFRVGRIFGIEIYIDWSWFFIFLLVTWNLSIVFGSLRPDWSTGLRWGLALAASLLFFASVLAHELAHSLMARAQGVPVRNITLFLFGGVSNIQRHPPSPQAEFLIAIVGPVTSILLGALFIFLAGTRIGQIGLPATSPQALISHLDPLGTLLMWLGPINIVLGIFNLIPGFPLDGGRILRSILWATTDNLRRATRWASWIGQGVAWLMIITGIAMAFGLQIPFLGTGFTSGLWLAFIGWFLNSASIQSYQQVLVQDILEGVPVREIMRSDPPVVSPDQSVSSLVHNYVMRTDEHAFPVLENDRLAGIVTLEDVRKVDRDDWEKLSVSDIMTPREQLQTVTIREDAADALNKIMQRDVRQLPVVQDGRLVGLLRRRDIVRWMQLQAEAGELR